MEESDFYEFPRPEHGETPKILQGPLKEEGAIDNKRCENAHRKRLQR